MNLSLLMLLFLPVVSSLKPKDVLRKCYQGVFLQNSKKTNTNLTIVESKVCLAQLRYNVQFERDVILEDGTRGNRRICRPETIAGEVREVRDDEIMDRWNKVTNPPELPPGPINPGYEIELEDDAEERQRAEANGSVSPRPTQPPLPGEESILPPHCRWLPGGAGHQDNVTCYCYTDYCNDANDGEKFMRLLLSNCYARREAGETEGEYEAKCPTGTKNAISCLQKPVERALNAKPKPPIEVVRNSTDTIPIDSITWIPDDEFQKKYTIPPTTVTPTSRQAGQAPGLSVSKTIIISTCGGLLVLLAGGCGLFLCIKKRQEEKDEEGEEGEDDYSSDAGDHTAFGSRVAVEEGEAPLDSSAFSSSSDKPSVKKAGSDEMRGRRMIENNNEQEEASGGVVRGAARMIEIPDMGGEDSGSEEYRGGELSNGGEETVGGGGGQQQAKEQRGGKREGQGKGAKRPTAKNSQKKAGGKGKKQTKKKPVGGKKGKSKSKTTKSKAKPKKKKAGGTKKGKKR